MPRCIFCGEESEKLSSEHVFPAVLGGKLELENASCTTCNNGFSGVEFALREPFAGMRTYIKSGEGQPRATLFLNAEYAHACYQGPHMHSIVLVGRRDKRRVDAIVRLFGGLFFLVNLADNHEGADFYKTFLYDAQKGEEKQILFLHEQSEFLQIEHVITSKDSIWNDRVKSGQFFVKFLDNAIQAQLKAEQGNQQAAQPS
jgi:hypothetical protein